MAEAKIAAHQAALSKSAVIKEGYLVKKVRERPTGPSLLLQTMFSGSHKAQLENKMVHTQQDFTYLLQEQRGR